MTETRNIKTKVCGMRDSLNIQEISSLMPDYMGFIFYGNSPRYVGDDFKLPDFPSTIKRVGVFVNEPINLILDTIKRHQLDFAQLHGDESVRLCNKLNHEGVSVIKVFRVGDDFDFSETKEFEDVSEYFLFDTKGRNYGGNAARFNWQILTKYNQHVPFFLSGGIDLENIEEVIQLKDLNLYAVDINSGVEHSPARKDKEKVSTIINKLRV